MRTYEPRKASDKTVDDIAAYARRKGISTEDAQDLYDRVGCDREALDEAVDILQSETDD